MRTETRNSEFPASSTVGSIELIHSIMATGVLGKMAYRVWMIEEYNRPPVQYRW